MVEKLRQSKIVPPLRAMERCYNMVRIECVTIYSAIYPSVHMLNRAAPVPA